LQIYKGILNKTVKEMLKLSQKKRKAD